MAAKPPDNRGGGPGKGESAKTAERLKKMQSRIGAVQKSVFLQAAKLGQAAGRTLKDDDITVNILDTRVASRSRGPFGYLDVIVMDPGNDRDSIMVGDFDSSDRDIFMGDKDPTDGTRRVDKDLGGDQP